MLEASVVVDGRRLRPGYRFRPQPQCLAAEAQTVFQLLLLIRRLAQAFAGFERWNFPLPRRAMARNRANSGLLTSDADSENSGLRYENGREKPEMISKITGFSGTALCHFAKKGFHSTSPSPMAVHCTLAPSGYSQIMESRMPLE